MAGASSFIVMLRIAGFLGCAWTATTVSRLVGVSSIVLEIATGLILGPSVLKLVVPEYAECQESRHLDCTPPPNLAQLIAEGKPLGEGLGMIANMQGVCPRHAYMLQTAGHERAAATGDQSDGEVNTTEEVEWEWGWDGANATNASDGDADEAESDGRRLGGSGPYRSYEECLVKSCEAEVANQCQSTPGFFKLVGQIGVSLMIFESGMHFDFEKARHAGPKPCCVAVVGILLPLISGALLMVIYGRPLVPDGVSVGVSIAPTSIGIVLRLLGEAKAIKEEFGQAIVTAAFVGDILSLVLIEVLFSSFRGNFSALSAVIFPIISVACIATAIYLAVKLWPRLIYEVIFPKLPVREGTKVCTQDEALLLLMMTILAAYATVAHFLGSHLWGCFVAGVSFACLDEKHDAHQLWVKQTKRITSWMIRIFFAATVAFSIPVGQFLSFDVFLKGSLMGIGPCILAKVLCAPFMGPARFVIGWGMVNRAELAYLVAQMAAAAGMMDSATFSIVIWALLYANIFTPFIFRKVLNAYLQAWAPDMEDPESADSKGIGQKDLEQK